MTSTPEIELKAQITFWKKTLASEQRKHKETRRKLFHARREVLEEAAKERDRLHDALERAANQFDFYAQEHRQKARNSRFNGIEVLAQASDEKAQTNENFAAMCRRALSNSPAPEGSAEGVARSEPKSAKEGEAG